MNKDIYLSNSLGGKKDLFTPINKKKVRMYVWPAFMYSTNTIALFIIVISYILIVMLIC